MLYKYILNYLITSYCIVLQLLQNSLLQHDQDNVLLHKKLNLINRFSLFVSYSRLWFALTLTLQVK